MTEAITKETVEGFLLNKKTDDYKDEHAKTDFALAHELTVTITLREYRALVENAATSAARIKEAKEKANKEYWRADAAEKKLKAVIEKFTDEIDEIDEDNDEDEEGDES